ncbi:hexose kinase [Isobaculum melis]|uniref:Tagatose-6-phosphate kinase n=1 Tax=Isobaculum melis TaxID=142588 RepID=A0A1H9THY6_9LACT|nr:hexose kinase [Isobaculum melis]SER96233.1 tagatose-6-phosphate kinase [Isobaculum melis]
MILAVTLNPSVDIAYSIAHFALDDVNRTKEVSKTAGGKGLNVARVIHLLGKNVLATGIVGGELGGFMERQLSNDGIAHEFLQTDQPSRNCIAILHDDGKQTEILEAGPTLGGQEAQQFLQHFKHQVEQVSVVTISGSLPLGLPINFYCQLLAIAAEKQVKVLLDCSGPALEATLKSKYKPYLIKPNLSELSQIVEKNLNGDIQELKAVLKDERFTGIACMVISMGAQGAFVKYHDAFYQVEIPKIEVVNPVGSGDATVAGLAVAISEGKTIEAILATAMTTGMLNTMEAQTGYISITHFDAYYQQVKVTKID